MFFFADSATALFFGAGSASLGGSSVRFHRTASAALGRSLLSVTFLAASAALGRRGAAACHQAGARHETGYAEPRQELLEFPRIHWYTSFHSLMDNSDGFEVKS
jgi:hypothetical protein